MGTNTPLTLCLLLEIADSDLIAGKYVPARLQGRVRGGLERRLHLV
jgi:hypothetical protein